MQRARVTGVVLAGGRGSRFGRDKTQLRLGGETLLSRAVRALDQVAADVIVLGPPERAEGLAGVRVLPDERPGDGPLPALATALRARRGDRILAVAADMPLLNPALLAALLDWSEGYDVTVPRVEGRTQQLHAVYAPACLPPIEAQLARDDLKIDRFFPSVRLRIVEEAEIRPLDPDLHSFRNINTEADWQAIREIAGE